MEAPIRNLLNETKSLEKRIEEERQQTKSLQSLLEDCSISSFTANDIDSMHQRSMHDINLCIEKIEELSTECKSLLSVIQDLERGNSEFLSDATKKRKSGSEVGNSIAKDLDVSSAESEKTGRRPPGEVTSESEKSFKKSPKF